MAKNIYIFLEIEGKTLSEQSAEILGAALRAMPGSKITAIVPQATMEEVNNLPVNTVYYGGDDFPSLPTNWAKAAAELEDTDFILATMTVNGREFASAYAAEKALSYIPAVSGFELKPEGLLVTRMSLTEVSHKRKLF